MNIAMPICFLALVVGLFSRRITPKAWFLLFIVVVVIVARYYFTFKYTIQQ